MKIVEGSFQLQNEEIIRLIEILYEDIFPRYLSASQINSYRESQVLSIPDSLSELGTLKGAFQAIACLQTIIIIMEKRSTSAHDIELFNKNARLLNELNIFFPFEHHHFFQSDIGRVELNSEFLNQKAANSYLI